MSTTLHRLIAVLAISVVARSIHAQQRDRMPQAVSGTASIRGRLVTDTDPPQPIARAIVTLSGDLPANRGAITDEDGRFAFAQLPQGRFTVAAIKPAYLSAAFGAARPGRPGTAIVLAGDEQRDIVIRMARGAVLTGTVTDRNGRPVPFIQVSAVRAVAAPNPETITSSTDDRGLYRIFGLMPGEYVVRATPRAGGAIGVRSGAELDALIAQLTARKGAPATFDQNRPRPTPVPDAPVVASAPTYFPGTSARENASSIAVKAGEERGGLDFQLSFVRTTTVEGTVSGPSQNIVAVQLSFSSSTQVNAQGNTTAVLVQRPSASDPSFKYTGVSPGRYRIMGRVERNQTTAPPALPPMGVVMSGSGSLAGPVGDFLYGIADIDIDGQDVVHVGIDLQPGSTLTGRLSFDASAHPEPGDVGKIRINLAPVNGTSYSVTNGTIYGNMLSVVAPAQFRPDGTFAISSIGPGTYKVNVELPNDLSGVWTLRSALADGRDVLDLPLEIQTGQNVENVVLAFSDRKTRLTGTLQTAAATPATDYFVVVFPVNQQLWRAGARRISSTRPASNGNYAFNDLPGGEYYIAALTDVEPADLGDPKFLADIVPASLRISLAEGETTTRDLRVSK
jgi:hypothetical protein